MELQLEELTVQPDSNLSGSSLKEAAVRRKLGVSIVAIKDAAGNMVCNSSPDARINAGDTSIALGEIKDLFRLEKILQAERE